jgi:hypothetical protein
MSETNWLDLKPAHFDSKLLPPRARREAAQPGLFSAADVAPTTEQASKTTPQLDGQGELFGPDGT